MTSEEILEFQTPPEHQCSNIDSYIKKVKKVEEYIRLGSKSDSIKEALDYISDIEWEVNDFEGFFENLRTSVEELRLWGQEWKDLAKNFIETYEPELLKGEFKLIDRSEK